LKKKEEKNSAMVKHPTDAHIKHIVRHVPCDMGKSLTLKLQNTHVLTADQIKQITRHMPRDVDELL
jgi:hypothetical protein